MREVIRVALRLREDFISRRRGALVASGLGGSVHRAPSRGPPSSLSCSWVLLDAKLMVPGVWEYQEGGSPTCSIVSPSEAQVMAP